MKQRDEIPFSQLTHLFAYLIGTERIVSQTVMTVRRGMSFPLMVCGRQIHVWTALPWVFHHWANRLERFTALSRDVRTFLRVQFSIWWSQAHKYSLLSINSLLMEAEFSTPLIPRPSTNLFHFPSPLLVSVAIISTLYPISFLVFQVAAFQDILLSNLYEDR